MVFKNEATLCMCSGIKFFNDAMGISVVQHIQTDKEPRSKLAPLLFRGKDIYSQYYFNAEALPLYQ